MILNLELLSNVLDEEVVSFSFDEVHNIIRYHRVAYIGMDNHKQIRADGKINLYEFSFKCKEWAYTKYDLIIWSGRTFTKLNITSSWDAHKMFKCDKDDLTRTTGIFKACVWLLNNKEWN